jgi:hypothetical protein
LYLHSDIEDFFTAECCGVQGMKLPSCTWGRVLGAGAGGGWGGGGGGGGGCLS